MDNLRDLAGRYVPSITSDLAKRSYLRVDRILMNVSCITWIKACLERLRSTTRDIDTNTEFGHHQVGSTQPSVEASDPIAREVCLLLEYFLFFAPTLLSAFIFMSRWVIHSNNERSGSASPKNCNSRDLKSVTRYRLVIISILHDLAINLLF